MYSRKLLYCRVEYKYSMLAGSAEQYARCSPAISYLFFPGVMKVINSPGQVTLFLKLVLNNDIHLNCEYLLESIPLGSSFVFLPLSPNAVHVKRQKFEIKLSVFWSLYDYNFLTTSLEYRSGNEDCVHMLHVLYIQYLYCHSAERPVLRYYCTVTKFESIRQFYSQPSILKSLLFNMYTLNYTYVHCVRNSTFAYSVLYRCFKLFILVGKFYTRIGFVIDKIYWEDG